MKKDPTIYLKHILESIIKIEEFMGQNSKADFTNNTQVQDAVTRRIEIIGEAVKNLPEIFKKKYPEVAWKDIAGTRDVLIHAYFSVDIDTVWTIVKKDIPVLKKQIKDILEKN